MITQFRKIHLLMPMSGQGTRYQKAGYKEPKPAIPVNGIPMVERLLNVFPAEWTTHFVMAENHKETTLPSLLARIRPQAIQSYVKPHSEGPAIAILEGLKNIPDDDSVLVTYCDYGMVWDPKHFHKFVSETDCDAAVISYRGFHAHYISQVNYAFSRLENEVVKEIREKGNFTDNRENEFASSGAYYFKTARQLREAVEFQIENQIKVNGEFYTSLTVQALIQMQQNAQVRVFEIPGFYQWGTPNDLRNFEYWEQSYEALNFQPENHFSVEQILLPMAGLGSRFKDLTNKKKPMIELEGRPMFLRALDHLPKSKKKVIVTVDEVAKQIQPLLGTDSVVKGLNYVPAGQALTVEQGLMHLDLDKEVLVSACDHGLVIEQELWAEFRKSNADAAIFGIQGFPEVDRKPNSYSYIEIDNKDKSKFPLVKKVSLKKPISETPSRDYLLVGTFWFRSGRLLSEGIEALKKGDQLMNGELYLDHVFNHFNEQGLKTVLFPLSGYFNWGDPQSLKEALYWKEIFMGHQLQPRSAYPGVKF